MEYRPLPGTGLQLSAIALGSWTTVGERLTDRDSAELLASAYDLGVNFFDCAETYADGATEEAVGRALRELGWPRETFVISGKVFWGVHGKRPNTWGLSRKHVVEGCHATLRRLGLDHLDLLLCHRADPSTPLLETVRAMTELVQRGTILYWGTSEWPAGLVEEAHRLASASGLVPPVVEQLQYNLLRRERVEHEYGLLRQRVDLGITTWSPLLYGLLAGRYDDGFPGGGRLAAERYAWLREEALGDGALGDGALDGDARSGGVLARIRAVNGLARAHGLAPSQLSLAWVLRNPAVTSAITGASTAGQLAESVGAIAAVELLDDELLARIDRTLGIGAGSPGAGDARALPGAAGMHR